MGLREHFFAPAPPRALGICRVLFYTWCLVQLYFYAPWKYALLPTEFWQPPLLLRAFAAPSAGLTAAACVMLAIAIAFCIAGLFTRVASIAAATLMTFAFGVVVSYGFISFHHCPLVLIAWVLALSRCGDAFSVDSWRRGKAAVLTPSSAYRWPIRVARIVLVVLMFSAGFHKTRGGWWSEPTFNMEYFVRFNSFAQADQKGLPIAWTVLELARYPTILGLMGWATVSLELFAGLALPDGWPRLRALIISGLFVMQLALAVLSTLATFPWLAAYVFWLPIGDPARGP